MTPDLVSIVVANHDYGPFVAEAVESALAQTHPAVEVIVVDDGSTDDSLARLRAMPALRGGSVQLVEQANLGVCRARNAGAARARGAWLLFLDADDALEPACVERCLRAMEAAPPSAAYAYTQMREVGAGDRIHAPPPFSRAALLAGNFVNASALVRRAAFEEAGGFDPAFTAGYEDYALWIAMLARGRSGVLVAEPLLRYRRHPGGSRNTLTERQRLALRFDIAVRHPRLYWGKLLRHPLRAASALRRLRLSRSAPAARAPPPPPAPPPRAAPRT